MKELLQIVDIEKCISLFKKSIVSLITCSMLMGDVAKAMDENEDKHDSSSSKFTSSSFSTGYFSDSDDDDAPSKEEAARSLSSSQLEEKKSSSPDKFFTYLSMDYRNHRDVRSKEIPLVYKSSTPNFLNTSIQSQASETETTPLLRSCHEIVINDDEEEEPYSDSQLGCCSGRPFFPTPDEYILQEGALEKASRLLALLSKTDPESHDRESSSPEPFVIGINNKYFPINSSPEFTSTSPNTATLLPSNSNLQDRISQFEKISSSPRNKSVLFVEDDEEVFSCDFSQGTSPRSARLTLAPSDLHKYVKNEFISLPTNSALPSPIPSTTVQPQEGEISQDEISEDENFFPFVLLPEDSRDEYNPDVSLQRSPSLPRNAVLLVDSESDGEPTAHLLSHDDLHRPMNYARFKGLLHSSAPSAIPHHDHEFDPTAAASQTQLLSSQSTWLQLLEDLKKLPASAKSQLRGFVHQVLNGKSTWPQRLGKWVIGPIIGGIFAYMMGPVYDGGIGYLYTQGAKLNNFIESNFLRVFLWYIISSAVPDGVSRNAHLWKKGIAYLGREGKEIGRMCAAGGISFLTAVIPPVYLITAEEFPIKLQGLHGLNNVYARTMLVGIPFLYLDAFASDFNIAWNALPEIKKWFGKLWNRLSLRSQLPVLQHNPRETFTNNLKFLEHFLFKAPKSVIDEIYNNVAQVREGAQVSCCENYDEALASQQAFAVLSYLLSLGDDVVEKQSKPKSIYDISVDVFNYLCLITGTPARALALQFIGATVFGLVCPDPIAQILGGIYMIFALLPQTGLEYQGMDNFFKRFIFEEDSHGHGAHPVYRGLTKLYCVVQGLIYTFPLAVLTLQAFQQWFGEGWWPLVAGIPFFIPEFAAQTYSFNGTYNQLVATSITNVHNTKTRKCLGKEPTSDWKRDWLIRFVQESRAELKHWHLDLMHKLTESITVFQKAEF